MTDHVYVPADFQHETDRLLMEKVNESSTLESLRQFLADNHIEAIYKYYYQSSYINVTKEMAPKITDMLERAARMFGLENPPRLYLTRDYLSGASVNGSSEPFILLSTDLLSRIDDDQMLWGVLASQTAAIAAGHHFMNYLLWIKDRVEELIPLNIIPKVQEILKPLTSAGLNKWAQWRTCSLDCAFYLATQNFPLAVEQIFLQRMSNTHKALFHLGKSEDKYLKQKEEFMNGSVLSNVSQTVNMFLRDDAWLPVRYRELEKFVNSKGGSRE